MEVLAFRRAAVYFCEMCRKPLPSDADRWQHIRSCVDPKRQLRVRLERLTQEQVVLACKSHAKQIEKPPLTITAITELWCLTCNLNFKDLNSRNEHNQKVHMPFGYGLNHNFTAKNAQNHSTWKCHRCSCSFADYRIYRLHLNWHQTKGCFKCVIKGCQKVYLSALELEEHSNEHKVFRCKECDEFFYGIEQLELHKKLHLQQWPFHCDVPDCSYGGTSRLEVMTHKQSAHGVAGLQCHFCGKIVKQLSNMKYHLELHKTGIPGVVRCGFFECRGMFFSADELKIHMLGHKIHKTSPAILKKKV